ncbi:MAG: helix-turn-helix transcriptional regulator [Clostridia bacterium]|nr:helix-turn-helix transcriptional regulator [Clostridia bacterium]
MTKRISDNIKKLRKKNHVTQEHLANVLGVSSQAVSRWECGLACPDIEKLPEIADFFNVTIDELFRSDKKKDSR